MIFRVGSRKPGAHKAWTRRWLHRVIFIFPILPPPSPAHPLHSPHPEPRPDNDLIGSFSYSPSSPPLPCTAAHGPSPGARILRWPATRPWLAPPERIRGGWKDRSVVQRGQRRGHCQNPARLQQRTSETPDIGGVRADSQCHGQFLTCSAMARGKVQPILWHQWRGQGCPP